MASSVFSIYWVFLFHFLFTVPKTDKIIMSEEESENTISTETLMKEMKRLQEEVKKQSMTNQTSFSYIAKERKGRKFSGEDPSVEVNDWVTGCRLALNASYSSRTCQVNSCLLFYRT